MVRSAEVGAVGGGRGPNLGPVVKVMSFDAPPSPATREPAAPIASEHGGSLRRCERWRAGADVEELAAAFHDQAADVGIAAEATSLLAGERRTTPGSYGASGPFDEGVVVDEHDDLGARSARPKIVEGVEAGPNQSHEGPSPPLRRYDSERAATSAAAADSAAADPRPWTISTGWGSCALAASA